MVIKIVIILCSVLFAGFITFMLWSSDEFKNDKPFWYNFYKIASKICIIFIWLIVIINAIILIRN